MRQLLHERRHEHRFFLAAALILGLIVGIGFWQSYISRGLVFATLPSVLASVHAALYVGWVILFSVQVRLVGTGRTAAHRRLGKLIALWALAMVLIGPLTVIMALRRPGSGIDGSILFADLAQVLLFAILIGAGLALRRHAGAHKRLMLLGSAAILLPAIARWPWDFMQKGPPVGLVLVYFVVPSALVVWDFQRLRRVHRATAFGAALMLLMVLCVFTLPDSSSWVLLVHWLGA